MHPHLSTAYKEVCIYDPQRSKWNMHLVYTLDVQIWTFMERTCHIYKGGEFNLLQFDTFPKVETSISDSRDSSWHVRLHIGLKWQTCTPWKYHLGVLKHTNTYIK